MHPTESHAQYIFQSLQILMVNFLSQADPTLRLRLDIPKFASSLSWADPDTNIRVVMRPWDLGPGWNGADTAVGKCPPIDWKNIQKSWSSDIPSSATFGNTERKRIIEMWEPADALVATSFPDPGGITGRKSIKRPPADSAGMFPPAMFWATLE